MCGCGFAVFFPLQCLTHTLGDVSISSSSATGQPEGMMPKEQIHEKMQSLMPVGDWSASVPMFFSLFL
jgi:hypothetical protein